MTFKIKTPSLTFEEPAVLQTLQNDFMTKPHFLGTDSL